MALFGRIPDDGFDQGRWSALRYLNLFRLVVAAVFAVGGSALGLGEQVPGLFSATALAYLCVVLLLGFPDAARRLGMQRLITLQLLLDLAALTLLMWASGGYRSGIPVLMLVVLAGSGLVAEGRMVLFYAALASVCVLAENGWRLMSGRTAADFFAVGVLCIGFFGIAGVARMLALRAKANESLAVRRGVALANQQAINEGIIRDMQDGVIVVNEQNEVRQANPQATALLGVPLGDGAVLREMVPDLADFLATGLFGEGKLLRLGRERRLLRCRVLSAGGAGGYKLIYLTDFDAIQKQAQQIKLAALGRLTASIAHEIRNPLTAISHAAELLQEEGSSELGARLLRIIVDNSRRIEGMVQDVLSLGRHEHAIPEPLELKGYLHDLVAELSLANPADVEVFRLEMPAGCCMAIDRGHLQQIMNNLLGNARRYCSGQPGAIRVWVDERPPDQILLHVCDDGSGIPDEERAQVFEPFFTTHAKGTGLGLYVARELAEANDATLDLVDNEPGAHFILTGRCMR